MSVQREWRFRRDIELGEAQIKALGHTFGYLGAEARYQASSGFQSHARYLAEQRRELLAAFCERREV